MKKLDTPLFLRVAQRAAVKASRSTFLTHYAGSTRPVIATRNPADYAEFVRFTTDGYCDIRGCSRDVARRELRALVAVGELSEYPVRGGTTSWRFPSAQARRELARQIIDSLVAQHYEFDK